MDLPRYLTVQIMTAVCLAMTLLTESRAEGTQREFNIARGWAQATLRQFGEQAGGQFIFSEERVTGVRTAEVKGKFTALIALSRMLEGTPLLAVQDPKTGALTVRRKDADTQDQSGTGVRDRHANAKQRD
jgi:hypothetical protein